MDSDPTVIGLVTQGLTEVKEAVSQLSRDLHSTLARLPNEYVPRREIERWRDEMTVAIGAERSAREAATKAHADALDKAEADRITARRWAIGLSAGTGVSLIGVLSGVILHFH